MEWDFKQAYCKALLFFALVPFFCEQVDKQVRTKTPYWIYREFPRGSRIGKSSPVPLGCPSDRYPRVQPLGTTVGEGETGETPLVQFEFDFYFLIH